MLREIYGKSAVGENMRDSHSKRNAAIGTLKAGDSIKRKVSHEERRRLSGGEKEIAITPVEASQPVFKVVDVAGGNAKIGEMWQGWRFGGVRF